MSTPTTVAFATPKQLTVFYDGRCALCTKVHDWLSRTELLIPIELRDLRSNSTQTEYPALRDAMLSGQFIVLADDGRTYFDTKAKLMVLYATSRYRDLSYRLSAPLLYPSTDRIFSAVAAGRWMLGSPPVADCRSGVCTHG